MVTKKNKDNLEVYVGSFVFLAFGVLMLLIPYSDYKEVSEFISTAEQAKGTVTEIEEEFEKVRDYGEKSTSTVESIVMTVEVVYNNEVFEILESSILIERMYEAGDEVDVLVNPDDLEGSTVDHFLFVWGFFISISVLGLMFLSGGVLLVRFLT